MKFIVAANTQRQTYSTVRALLEMSVDCYTYLRSHFKKGILFIQAQGVFNLYLKNLVSRCYCDVHGCNKIPSLRATSNLRKATSNKPLAISVTCNFLAALILNTAFEFDYLYFQGQTPPAK
ncbi:hypothetical protein OS493_032329 [Desmophyllum pertusum]|uniref:Uncharacterized protein n=1 Tax=Desmophyllum pertusum TaxID=174260 RepID=A0A9X0CR54_9CNID|nr:hypothetical protein OS493_032329 [Desmophyllum pertusum]